MIQHHLQQYQEVGQVISWVECSHLHLISNNPYQTLCFPLNLLQQVRLVFPSNQQSILKMERSNQFFNFKMLLLKEFLHSKSKSTKTHLDQQLTTFLKSPLNLKQLQISSLILKSVKLISTCQHLPKLLLIFKLLLDHHLVFITLKLLVYSLTSSIKMQLP